MYHNDTIQTFFVSFFFFDFSLIFLSLDFFLSILVFFFFLELSLVSDSDFLIFSSEDFLSFTFCFFLSTSDLSDLEFLSLDFDRFRDEDFLSSFVLELDLFLALDRDLERLKFSVFSLEFSKKEFSKGEFSIESLLWGVFYGKFSIRSLPEAFQRVM